MNPETDYVFDEEKFPDGTTRTLIRNKAGVLIGEEFRDRNNRRTESRAYDEKGNLTNRTVYEQDGGPKALKITSYDAEGNLVFVQERDRPPIFHGKYKEGKPPFMRAD